mmetsp:Transcript_17172/g.36911  ORF Transcript_17172/g.36911 Transcript_17172/m.36911 type:complete len:275 (-) Transcript_17172:1711-2535(-)
MVSLSTVWQRCFAWSTDKMFGPAFLRQVVMPSIPVFAMKGSALAFSSSIFGSTRWRNSMTRAPTTSPLLALPAHWQRAPQRRWAISRMSSPRGKSKTGSKAIAVCCTNGEKDPSSCSTKVWTHSSAPCKSCSSDDRIRTYFCSPPSCSMPISRSLPISPSSRELRSLGDALNFARIPGSNLGTKGRKSSFKVMHILSAALIVYSCTGSFAGKFGTWLAFTIASRICSPSALKAWRPTALPIKEMHSKQRPKSCLSSTLCRVARTTSFIRGIKVE